MHMTYIEQPHNIHTKYNHFTVIKPSSKIIKTTRIPSLKCKNHFHTKKKRLEEEKVS